MFETPEAPQNSQTSLQSGRYFKLQMTGWTDFNPVDMTPLQITQAIESGGGVVTAIEVLEVEDNLLQIRDKEVLECFENIRAAKRVLLNLGELPKKLVEDLRSALRDQEAPGGKKNVGSASPQPDSVLKQG